MGEVDLLRLCRQLKPLIGDSADSLWVHYQLSSTPSTRLEAENTIRMMAVAYLGANTEDEEIRLPPPSTGNAHGEISLGEIRYPGRHGHRLGLDVQELTKHIGIFATTGSGKTNIVFNLLPQLHRRKIPFLAIDWKRSYRNLRTLPGLADLKVYTVGRAIVPFLWNPLRPPPNVHPQTWTQILAEILEKTHVSGQGVADVITDLADAEFASREFDSGTEPDSFPNFFDLRDRLERTRYSGRRALWRDSCLRILRTFTLGPAANTFNARNPAKLEELLSAPTVFELDMELPKSVRTFFTEAILRWIHLFRLGQGESEMLRHVLVLEEAHNIFPRLQDASSGGIENVYREIRSFGQGLVAITQHPSLLPIFVLGNTHTLIFLLLTHEADIIAARQSLFLQRSEDVFLDRLKIGEGIVKIKGRIQACHVQFPKSPIKNGALSDEDLRS